MMLEFSDIANWLWTLCIAFGAYALRKQDTFQTKMAHDQDEFQKQIVQDVKTLTNDIHNRVQRTEIGYEATKTAMDNVKLQLQIDAKNEFVDKKEFYNTMDRMHTRIDKIDLKMDTIIGKLDTLPTK